MLGLLGFGLVCKAQAEPLPDPVPTFVDQHCADCHDDIEMKGDLDLWNLSVEPLSAENLKTWIKVHDRAMAGEMPPEDKPRPQGDALDAFLSSLSSAITSYERQSMAETGRATKRRLNRYEYENSLRDLLSLPSLEVKDSLPEDTTDHGYNKIGDALDVSHVQIARYLSVAEFALRSAMAPQVEKPEKIDQRFYTWQQKAFHRNVGPTLRQSFPIVGHELQRELVGGRDPVTRERINPDVAAASRPERADEEAIVMLMSTYEPAEIKFNTFRAPVAGFYRLRFSGYSVQMTDSYDQVLPGVRPEPVTVYAQHPPRQLRHLASFDFGIEPTVQEIEVWLEAGESIQPDATRLVRSRPPDFENPLEKDGVMPGVAFQWMDVEGPLYADWPPAGHKLLFADLPIVEAEDGEESASGARHVQIPAPADPVATAERLLRRFMEAAYRRPPAEADVQRFLGLVVEALESEYSFTDSVIAGYTAVLASPGFIYLDATPGKLDGYALAERLSYFLWNSPPDETLTRLAASGELLEPDVLAQQVDRLLDHPKSDRFVSAFLDYWLDLRHMMANGPDAELYPEYQLDDMLVESMPVETQLFFKDMLVNNRSASHIVDSDFIIINGRLATLYDIPGVVGADFRKVPLEAESPRGGLMTQASVLKVTANGTTTSPVTRGVWIMERILGYHAPPPPPSVEAIESDVRGATTIREQLELHRSEQSCNSCHQKIDPAGFALESFDVMGGWRHHYRAAGKGEGERVFGVGHDGQEFRFRVSQPVDASGELPDGRAFRDVRELKKHLLQDKRLLARNLAQQLAIYATGAPIHFSDRQTIDQIVDATAHSDHGARDIIHELVKSRLFLYK